MILTTFGGGVSIAKWSIFIPLPDWAKETSFKATKNPSLLRKPFPDGSERSHILLRTTSDNPDFFKNLAATIAGILPWLFGSTYKKILILNYFLL